MGENVDVGYTRYSVRRAWYSDNLSSNEFLNEKPNGSFLFIELSVRNNDNEARTIPPFELVDRTGARYETSSNAWRVDGSIGLLESLNPGVSKRGFIVFDVPKGRKYMLDVSGGYWSSESARIRIDTK